MHIVQEEWTISRTVAFKKSNYSHCPLKKRPVYVFLKEEQESDRINEDTSDNNSEPENLSTKPEDLSVVACKTETPSHGVALISSGGRSEPPPSPVLHPLVHHGHFLSKGAPLEPLNLNTPAEHPTWHRPQPYYPSHYLPLNYPYPEIHSPYHPNEKPSAFSPPSPQQRFPPLPQPRPVYVHYPPPESGLSPAPSPSALGFTAYTRPFPTPEDLSSPAFSPVTPASRKKAKDSTSPRYQCSFCSKSYSTYSGLSKHQQFHCSANEDSTAKKTFSCKHCDKVYVSLGALKMHIRTHTLPCKCKLCGKAFSRPWLLQGHIRTHTGEKPFTCPHCNRAFADRSNLRAHLQTHSDVKKYSCTSCSKTFSRMSLLSKHCDGGCPGTASSPEHISSYPVSPS